MNIKDKSNKPQKKYTNLSFKIWFVLAIIGIVIIMMTAEMSKYRYFGESDIYNYLVPLAIGAIFVLPLIIYLIKSRRKSYTNEKSDK